MTEVLIYLETLARESRKPEAEVMTLAFETGLRQFKWPADRQSSFAVGVSVADRRSAFGCA